jgi:hypothetical protein
MAKDMYFDTMNHFQVKVVLFFQDEKVNHMESRKLSAPHPFPGNIFTQSLCPGGRNYPDLKMVLA